MYNADLPLTGPYLLTTLQEHPEIEVLYAVPYGLKLLSESEESMKILARLELVMFGGSSCPKPIGDKLAQNGVRLVSHYGTTETGQLMTSFRERSDIDWDYVRPGPTLLPYIRWEEQMPGIYELCVLEGWPSKVASNRPDGAYATKDLFEKHPAKENAWRYYARLDDTLVLENGEKANPLVIEGVARNHSNVGEAVAFGSNRSRLGLFLIRAEGHAGETDDQIIDSVLPAIEKCNAESPAYAYISRDMIRILPADAVYRKTDKGTVIRSAFYRDFAEQINQVYDQEDASGNQVLEGDELTIFLRNSLLDVASVEPSALQDSTDVFSLGVDSLQSLRLRSIILKTLSLGGQKLSQNFVFENPSIEAMARELTRLRLGSGPQLQTPIEERMTDLIERYSRDFKKHVPVPRNDDGEYVVVTGATGSLGAHIVAQLVQSESVRKVYCLVRAHSPLSAFHRVRQSLHARFLLSDLSPDAERKIVALPADLSNKVRLGLHEAVYQDIISSVTAVMHCAWSVNFNWALESFEQSCIAATRNLLDLCLETRRPQPAKFSFCSSVSTVARTPGNWIPEALPESLTYAQSMGYAQSKLVTEHIVNQACRKTTLSSRVLRVGQIIADTNHGIWNASEAIPMIFQTAETINALPLLDDILSWTPVDTVASSIIEATLSSKAAEVMNVTNPTLNHWTQDLLPLLEQAGLTFEALPKREWLARLRASNPDPTINPPVKLLSFFANKYDNDLPARVLLYDTKNCQSAAPSLRDAAGLTQDFVTRFIQYFRRQAWSVTHCLNRSSSNNVIFLTGPCGSGKSTAALSLATKFNATTIEGDDLHSRVSRAKMAAGNPLSDLDRWEWLSHIRGAVMDRLFQPCGLAGVVVTCSALKKAYRDELRKLAYLLENPVNVTFIHLSVGEDRKAELKERLVLRSKKEGHYMESNMVDSQLEALESPEVDERDVVVVDAAGEKESVLEEVEAVARGVLL
jgi:carbohydrate kinase (thermoresistant glucokinase family)